jgi:LemA protein
MSTYVLLGIVLAVALWAGLTYNRLVRLRNMVKEAWSGIDVQLKRRSALIPNLVETVKGYMGHERGLLGEIAELRSRGLAARGVAQKGEIETALSRTLGSLFAVAEGYPDLKASTNFLALQTDLAQIEDQIQMARRYYNGTVRNLNIAVESFPSNVVAGIFRFTQAEFFALEDEADRLAPKVSMEAPG